MQALLLSDRPVRMGNGWTKTIKAGTIINVNGYDAKSKKFTASVTSRDGREIDYWSLSFTQDQVQLIECPDCREVDNISVVEGCIFPVLPVPNHSAECGNCGAAWTVD